MNTRTTLMAGFGLLIALLLAAVALSLVRLESLGGSVERLAAQRVPKMIAVSQASQALMQSSRQMRNALLLDSEAQIKTELAEILANDQRVAYALQEIEKVLEDDVERGLYKDIVERRAAYQPLEAQFVKLAQRGDYATAKDLMLEKIEAAQGRYIDAIGLLNEHAASESQVETNRSRAAVVSSRWILGVFALFAIFVAIVSAFVIVRMLMRRLGGEPAYAAQVAARIASGDLASDVALAGAHRDSLLASMKRMRDDLAGAVGIIRRAADGLAEDTRQIASGNAELSSRTEEQASSLEESASSMEELMSTVSQNAQSAQHASELAKAASGVAERGSHAMQDVIATMQDISASSRKIGDIIGVIDSIAFQTNILALNAAVEAARAGEQGRGFAVVATEVRSLAQRSAGAAKEIKQIIQGSSDRVEDGTRLVEGAGRTMDELVVSVKQVNGLIADIASASHEQASGITQVSHAVAQMEQVTQQNAALVEQSAAAAENMAANAEQLVASVSRFRIEGVVAAAVPAPAARPPVASPARALRAAGAKRLSRNEKAPETEWEEF
jgi:methyl-accepting chemotaxis protein